MSVTPEVFSAPQLMRQNFPPLQYVVPGIIPEGETVLVAPPKIGKSWLVLALALAVSGGTRALGVIPVGAARPVLYLALEDGPRRLQDRIKSLDPATVPEALYFRVDLGERDVVAVIREFVLEHHGRAPVVILDTLGKVMNSAAGNDTQYAHDYRFMSSFKQVTDSFPGSSIVIVHHTRKSSQGDFLDSVSGTQGIAGAADTILKLERERHGDGGTLHVTSRDAAEGEYALAFESNGQWVLDGSSLEDAARAASTAKQTAGVGDRMGEVIEFVSRYPEGVRVRDVEARLDHVGDVRKYLTRAHDAGRIARLSRGVYGPVTSVTSVPNDDHPTGKVTLETHVTPIPGDTGTDPDDDPDRSVPGSIPPVPEPGTAPAAACSICEHPLWAARSRERGHCDKCAHALTPAPAPVPGSTELKSA